MIDPETAKTRKRETLEKATNLIQDLEEIRTFLDSGIPNRSRLRAFSGTLRRMFTQQLELQRVAEVRIPDFKILAPDFSAFHGIDGNQVKGFAGGSGNAYGISVTASMIGIGQQFNPGSNFKPGVLNLVSIKDFLKHKVVFWRGTWFTRVEIISFVANNLGVSHSGELSNNKDRKLKDFTQHAHIEIVDDQVQIHFQPPSDELKTGPLVLRSNQIDLLLFEISCYGAYLIQSPDYIKLAELVALEIDGKGM